jgi:subtilase family serine protease
LNGAKVPVFDLHGQRVTAPGYSNGNLAYLDPNLDNFLPPNNSTPTPPPASCVGIKLTLDDLSRSPNFGIPNLRVTFTADTSCGTAPFAVTWTFGDGNISTQTSVNITISGGRWYDDFIYNHTYHYVGAFVAEVSIVDGAGTHVKAYTSIYASFVPSLFYSFYNESGLINRGLNGSTYSIGLVEQCSMGWSNSKFTTDLATFDTTFGLSTASLTFVKPNATNCAIPNGNWPFETTLDIEWAHVAAPGAKIYVCQSSFPTLGGTEACDQFFYNNHVADDTMIVSNSWDFCAWGSGYTAGGQVNCVNNPDPYNSTWSSAKTAGMNILSSSGDFAPGRIVGGQWTSDWCSTSNYPASNPGGIAVGGTTITSVGPAGSYGSEVAYYNASAIHTQCYQNPGGVNPVPGRWGETYGTNPSYPANFTPWQVPVLGNSYRYFSDVGLLANPETGVPIVYGGVWYVVGGTSVGSPVWAGILDMLFQAGAAHLSGFAPPFLYAYPGCFHIMTNLQTGGRDGLGTPDIGCLAAS